MHHSTSKGTENLPNLVPTSPCSPTPLADGRRRFAGSSITSASGPIPTLRSSATLKSATTCTLDESLVAKARD